MDVSLGVITSTSTLQSMINAINAMKTQNKLIGTGNILNARKQNNNNNIECQVSYILCF